MTKRQLAQKRNYFKFVVVGMYKPIDSNCLTGEEKESWYKILEIRQQLNNNFDDNSRKMGLNVPAHRCWCGKEAKYTLDYVYKGESPTWVCKKHYEI